MNPNPNPNAKRGCFIRKENNGMFTVVDYPTWTYKKYGMVIPYQNMPIVEGLENERTFQTNEEARQFALSENYMICKQPDSRVVDNYEDYEDYEDYEG